MYVAARSLLSKAKAKIISKVEAKTISKVEAKIISKVEPKTISKVRAETASKALKVMEEEAGKEICKQWLENWEKVKEWTQNNETYKNMANQLDSLGQKMHNGYQGMKEQAQNSEIYKKTTASMKYFRDMCTSAAIEGKNYHETFMGLNSKSPTEFPDQKTGGKSQGIGG